MAGAAKPKLLFVVTEDWYFYSHRRPMVRAAQEAGLDVAVITSVNRHRQEIEALGVRVIDFSFERRSLNPLLALRQLARLTALYREERPAVVHHIAMKPIFLGALAAIWAQVPCVINAFAGLGFVFSARRPLALAIKFLLTPAFFILLKRPNSYLLLQNGDDLQTLKALGLVREGRTKIIRGSGVDLAEYPAAPLPAAASEFICVFAGRMIGIKGLPTLKEAFGLLATQAPHVRLHLYGRPDPANPGSWSLERLKAWDAESDNVAYKGQSEDMKTVWARAHVALQPSYGGEGVPKALLEAASCGRAIVATDVPGCREVVEQGRNGYLVPPYDASALAQAIMKLAGDAELCARMGQESRKIAESEFSAESVQAQTAAFYRQCLDETVRAGR